MNKTEETKFFNGTEYVLGLCFDYLSQKYDLGWKFDKDDEQRAKRPLSAGMEKYYEEDLPNEIREKGRAFDFVLGNYKDPIMQEIAANLESMMEDRKVLNRYVISLLKPFVRYSENTRPRAIKKRCEREINECEKGLITWGGRHKTENR